MLLLFDISPIVPFFSTPVHGRNICNHTSCITTAALPQFSALDVIRGPPDVGWVKLFCFYISDWAGTIRFASFYSQSPYWISPVITKYECLKSCSLVINWIPLGLSPLPPIHPSTRPHTLSFWNMSQNRSFIGFSLGRDKLWAMEKQLTAATSSCFFPTFCFVCLQENAWLYMLQIPGSWWMYLCYSVPPFPLKKTSSRLIFGPPPPPRVVFGALPFYTGH